MISSLEKQTSSAPLATIRIALGLMLFVGMVRFWTKGWIYDLYIEPSHFFSYYGFGWIKPLGEYTYLLFAVCMTAAVLVMIGLYYKLAITCLFLSFTYIELMDKSTYLNHYYFVSLLCFVLMFLPANASFSVDSFRNRKTAAATVPRWTIGVVRLLVFILYFYAGLAKINSDWLLNAMPLKIWLPARNDTPVIGALLGEPVVAYFFSWFGCLYDLTIVFFLLNSRTRNFAYLTVVAFHLMTALLFPIGMFPYIMILAALVFFPAAAHEKWLTELWKILRLPFPGIRPGELRYGILQKRVLWSVFVVFFLTQIFVPFRYSLYPGELFWSEEGYRFSWRVMLMEKAGYTQFTVKDADGKQIIVNNNEFLTPLQEKMMSTQPDMMLQYAHMLKEHFLRKGFHSPQVYVDSYVALNGRLGRPLADPDVDLAIQSESFRSKSWIIPLEDEIKGL